MKTIIKYIITVILAILVLAVYFLNLISSTVLSKEYVLGKLEKEDYYDKIFEQVKSNFENYIYQSGLKETVLENIVTKEKLENDTKIIIDNIYNETAKELDVEEIKENLYSNIEKSIGAENITSAQRIAINTFIDHICNEYKTTISYFNFEAKLGIKLTKIFNYINLAKKVLLITITIDFLLLLVLNLKGTHKFVSLIGVSLTIDGLFLLFTNIYINTRIKIHTITILNDAVSQVLRNALKDILGLIVKHGSLFTIIGFVVVIVSNFIYYKRYSKTHETNEK